MFHSLVARIARLASRTSGLVWVYALVPAPALAVDPPDAVETTRIGTVIGRDRPAPDGYYASDLGFSTVYRDYGILAFGDTYASAAGDSDPTYNDVWGYFPLDTADIDQLVDIQWWPANLRVINQTQGALPLAGGSTPGALASFDDPRGWYGLFIRGGAYARCSSDADCQGLTCDKGMGLRSTAPLWMPDDAYPDEACVIGDRGCLHVDGDRDRGLCRDTTSSLASFDGADARDARKVLTAAHQHELGRVQTPNLANYETYAWVTNKFTNATMRATVGYSDYRRPEPATGSLWSVLWLWGRPSYWSSSNDQAPAELYLAANYAGAMPDAANGTQLFYRTMNGWSHRQRDAQPLEAEDGWADGVMGHMSMTYLEGAKRWVMLYGGGTPTVWDDYFGGPMAATTQGNTDGTIKLRVASDPWGPWSAPIEVLGPERDDTDGDVMCGELAGPLMGYSRCPASWWPDMPPEPMPAQQGKGVLYAPAIFEGFNASTPHSAEIGWFVSTWNPYQVHQMKTTLQF